MEKLKVCNAYCGIGGNRKLWKDVEVTAVENNPDTAKIYQDFFPEDKVIVGDAHQYLLDHFEEFDFIWSSPPCPTHSKFRKYFSVSAGAKPIYPDMKLYEEILFLDHYFKGKYCVENVIGYYIPLIKPQEVGSHYFWSNFFIGSFHQKNRIKDDELKSGGEKKQISRLQEIYNIDIGKYKNIKKKTVLRNAINPHLGLHILNESKRDIQPELFR